MKPKQSKHMTNTNGTYCVDGGQGEREVEVVAVVDVSVLHEFKILISHHLHKQTEIFSFLSS